MTEVIEDALREVIKETHVLELYTEARRQGNKRVLHSLRGSIEQAIRDTLGSGDIEELKDIPEPYFEPYEPAYDEKKSRYTKPKRVVHPDDCCVCKDE